MDGFIILFLSKIPIRYEYVQLTNTQHVRVSSSSAWSLSLRSLARTLHKEFN